MTKTTLSASIMLVMAALSTLAVAQSVTPRTPAVGNVPAKVTIKPRATSPVMRLKVTTPAARAADLSRKGLLVSAKRTATPPGMTKVQYLKLMDAVWGQDLDTNGDGILSWQAGPESLGPQVGACVVVKYKHQDAKKEKDLSHPGQWVETPEAWVPEDWLTWGEVLSTAGFDGGECQVIGTQEVWRCMTADGQKPLPPPEPGWKMPNLPCYSSLGFPTTCDAKTVAKRQCDIRGGLFQTYTKMDGCEKWEHFGPDSKEAFLSVAAQAFNAEDHNANGIIETGESQYLCFN